jgi:hypothetical protein
MSYVSSHGQPPPDADNSVSIGDQEAALIWELRRLQRFLDEERDQQRFTHAIDLQSEDRPPNRLIRKRRSVQQFEDEIVGRVFDHPDLLENHLSLEREIALAQGGVKYNVADHVCGFEQMLIEHAALIHRVLARRVRVERAAECLERQRDLVCAAALGALEHHMLEEMRDAHDLARFVE